MSSTERPLSPTKAAAFIHDTNMRNLSPRKMLDKENYRLTEQESAATKHNDLSAITKLDPSARRISSQQSPRRQHMGPFSPRKQLARNADVSFTPCRAQLPPRAWERVPAKPFAARSEGQKIWKRVPLQDIGIDPNVHGRESRRDKNAKQDYLRAVKKMKVDSDVRAKDDQTALADGSSTTFWATRTEEESIEERSSPKKKAPHQSAWEHIKVDEKEMQEAIEAPENHECVSEERTDSTERERGLPTESLSCDADEPAIHGQEITTLPTEQSPNVTAETSCSVEVTSISSPASAISQNASEERATLTSQTIHDQDQSLTAKPITAQNDEHCSQTMDESESEGLSMADNLVTESPACSLSLTHGCDQSQSPPTTGVEGSKEDTQTEERSEANKHIEAEIATTFTTDSPLEIMPTPSDTADTADTADTVDLAPAHDIDLFDLSAPTKLVECEPPKSPEIEENTTVDEILASMPSPDVNKAALSRSTSAITGLEQEEDTAFLADFLLRAKASKAARAASTMPLSMIEPSSSSTEDVLDKENSPTNAPSEEKALRQTQTIESSMTEPSEETEQTIESSASSPLRRSTRRANTRLPRPQALPPVPQFGPVLPSQNIALPNTIQLKRATGNEFVFNAKPQQNVHIMTRTNTKRNQGNAVHADVRLQQLKSEGVEHNVDSNGQQSISPLKKRKRGKDDESRSTRKSKKNVKWQEELVSYREPTPFDAESNLPAADDFAAIEAAAQAEALRSMTESFKMPDTSKLEITETETEQEVNPDKPDDDGVRSKVRKVRRINVGNVNGTPAPKTRTRSQLQVSTNTDTDVDIATETPTTSSKSGSSASKKSKMPLPVSTISTGTTTAPQPIERKLDGRRRLRART